MVTVTDLNRAYPEATEILACYQEECVRGEPRQGGAQVLIPKRLKERRDLRVTLTILGRKEVFARSTTVARLEPSFPNGRECDRGCVNGRITYQATNDRWVER